MQLTDIITNDNWHGDRLAVFTTTTTAGAELQISEWLEDDGLDVELRDSHARANHADELATLEAEGRDAPRRGSPHALDEAERPPGRAVSAHRARRRTGR